MATGLMLAQCLSAERSQVGSKAWVLARLQAAGLPVPPACCLPPDCDYDAAAVLAWLGRPVVVRSSACSEDTATSSQAGRYQSVANCNDDQTLIAAVDQCRGLPRIPVLIQRQVAGKRAGVLFTRDPQGGSAWVIEAIRGFGGELVGGRRCPERYRLDAMTGLCHESPARPSLSPGDLATLHRLGQQVETVCGPGQDIEWVWDDEQCWIVQARPITAAAETRAQLRAAEIARLRKAGETAWRIDALAESCPAPTPMTWALLTRWWLSGQGGLGRAYRALGFRPHPALAESGSVTLIGGRPYQDQLAAQRWAFADWPIALDPGTGTARADYPLKSLRFWLSLPRLIGQAWRTEWQIRLAARELEDRVFGCGRQIVQESQQICDVARRSSLSELIATVTTWSRRLLAEQGETLLQPAVLAGLAVGALPPGTPVPAVRPAAEADLSQAWGLPWSEVVRRFGHRAAEELELAAPRWSELPEPPARFPKGRSGEAGAVAVPEPAAPIEPLLATAAKWLSLRETARHFFLIGYAALRQILLAIDQERQLDGGVFYLKPEELAELENGENLAGRIAQRRQERGLLLGLPVPATLLWHDLDAMGREEPVSATSRWRGVGLSPGVVDGPVFIAEPSIRAAPAGSIVAARFGDPLAVWHGRDARGFVFETAGLLSHVAIVAREWGVPAVGQLPDLLVHLRAGDLIRINGSTGLVERLRP